MPISIPVPRKGKGGEGKKRREGKGDSDLRRKTIEDRGKNKLARYYDTTKGDNVAGHCWKTYV